MVGQNLQGVASTGQRAYRKTWQYRPDLINSIPANRDTRIVDVHRVPPINAPYFELYFSSAVERVGRETSELFAGLCFPSFYFTFFKFGSI